MERKTPTVKGITSVEVVRTSQNKLIRKYQSVRGKEEGTTGALALLMSLMTVSPSYQ